MANIMKPATEKSGRDVGTAAICSLSAIMTQDRGAKMSEPTIIKIKDEDTGEIVEYEECQSCNGMGGDDWSKDPEVYDDWHDCYDCEGRGYVEPGHFEKDVFVPERDAFTPND